MSKHELIELWEQNATSGRPSGPIVRCKYCNHEMVWVHLPGGWDGWYGNEGWYCRKNTSTVQRFFNGSDGNPTRVRNHELDSLAALVLGVEP